MADTLKQELSVLLAPQHGLVLCALISAALLGGALLFEHVGGMAPCSLCIWQRWAHVAVIVCALGWLVFCSQDDCVGVGEQCLQVAPLDGHQLAQFGSRS